MTVSDLNKFIVPGTSCYLIGICGVSMAPLAEALLHMGLRIGGSDISDNETATHLRTLGIEVSIGHRAENIVGADFIVRTAAVRDENPEIEAAQRAGIPIFERAQAWGYIMRCYRNAICIAGTHGKTTTTSMTTHILMTADKDPTVMIGGTLPMLRAGHRLGADDTIILESCEYYNSFHSFSPTVAVILNVEADHLDFFKDLEDVKKSFQTFAALVPETGSIIANADDENTMDALATLGKSLKTFGLGENAHVRAVNISQAGSGSSFDAICHGAHYAHIELGVPGIHNVRNALAAITVAISLDIPPRACVEGLAAFGGAVRRFEHKGSFRGAEIYDDYAHHPSELKALLDAIEPLGYSRTIVAFQPHTYSRTKKMLDEFSIQLRRPDVVILADIYAAREKNTVNISSKDLAARIPNAIYCGSFGEIENIIREIAAPGDIILTVGAGDIFKIGERLLV